MDTEHRSQNQKPEILRLALFWIIGQLVTLLPLIAFFSPVPGIGIAISFLTLVLNFIFTIAFIIFHIVIHKKSNPTKIHYKGRTSLTILSIIAPAIFIFYLFMLVCENGANLFNNISIEGETVTAMILLFGFPTIVFLISILISSFSKFIVSYQDKIVSGAIANKSYMPLIKTLLIFFIIISIVGIISLPTFSVILVNLLALFHIGY